MGEEHSQAPLPFRKEPRFVMGATDPRKFPDTILPEVAVIGRSNVGKSSLINALVGREIARTSKTPGRTREINFFELGGNPAVMHLVDLPGYGFAKMGKTENQHWAFMCRGYLSDRRTLKRALLLLDGRHDLMEADKTMLELLVDWRTPFNIVLTKTDGSKKVQIDALLQQIKDVTQDAVTLQEPVFKTSASKRNGLRDLQNGILQMIVE